MLDCITRRRLIICFAAILFVTVSILFIAHLRSTIIQRVVPSLYSLSPSNTSTNDDQQMNSCYLTEPFDIIISCRKCRSYEQRSKAMGCLPTSYREFIFCSKSNTKTYRSCLVPVRIQKRRFWYFEGAVLLICLLALTSVQSRQKALDKQMVEKIKRQIEISEE